MPRLAKPYKERGWYISRAGGEYLRLCPIQEGMAKAKSLLRVHLEKRQQEKQRSGGLVQAKLTVSELFIEFLKTVEAEKSADTFAYYQRWCVEFAKKYGNRQARDVTRFDAQQFKTQLLESTYTRPNRPPRRYKPKTVNHALITLRKAFYWAIDTQLLPQGSNPFARCKLLPCQGRQRIVTESEYQALLTNCRDDHFRDVLIAMRFTSARPGDIRCLTWRMVDWDKHRWVITEHKTSKTVREPKPRIIGMNEVVEEVLRRRFDKYGQTERVFLNEDSKPWTRNALVLRMRRLRQRAGVLVDERGEELVLYTNRHTFLTQGAMNPDIPFSVLVEIAGHTDGRTTRRYTHIADQAVAEKGRAIADSLRPQPPTPGK